MPVAMAVNAPAGKRVLWIDLLRIWAMLTILLMHTREQMASQTAGWSFAAIFLGSAAPFFMTSGALILPLRQSPGKFLWHRLRSYVPQMVFWTVAYALLRARTEEGYDALWHLEWAFFQPTWQAGWFLYALTGLYLFAPVLSAWIAGATKRQIEVFLCLWLASGLIPFAGESARFLDAGGILGPFFGYCGYAVAGYYLTRWPMRGRARLEQTAFFGIMLLLAGGLGYKMLQTGLRWGYPAVVSNDLGINVMAAVCALFAAFSYLPTGISDADGHRSAVPQWLHRAAGVLGASTLGTYLCHTALLNYWLAPMHMPWPLTFAVLTLTAFGAGTVLRRLRLG